MIKQVLHSNRIRLYYLILQLLLDHQKAVTVTIPRLMHCDEITTENPLSLTFLLSPLFSLSLFFGREILSQSALSERRDSVRLKQLPGEHRKCSSVLKFLQKGWAWQGNKTHLSFLINYELDPSLPPNCVKNSTTFRFSFGSYFPVCLKNEETQSIWSIWSHYTVFKGQFTSDWVVLESLRDW